MRTGVQLVLPGLFDLPLQELAPGFVTSELPCLNRILGRASALPNQDYSIDSILRSALALQPGTAGLPVARAFAGEGDDGDRLLLVEAVHLQADLHGAIAMPIPKSNDNLRDISLLINDLRDIFKVDFDITAVAEGLYRMQLKGFVPPAHYPHPLSVLGKSVSPYVEQSRAVLPWYQLQNEMQMYLHQHAVNAERLQQGKLAINSLWAWGAGAPAELARKPDWYGDDDALNRFAGMLGMTVAPCSAIADHAGLEHAVIVDLRLLQLLKTGFDGRLDELLLDIEHGLIAPLMQALVKRPAPLRLRAGYRFDFELQPSARLKFWRRARSLAHWGEEVV